MKRIVCALVCALALAAPLAGQSNAGSNAAFPGVWRVAELRIPQPDGSIKTISTPQPGLMLMTAKHYSAVLTTSDKPRLPVKNAPETSAADLREAYFSLTSQAGTYAVAGDTITMRAIVSRNVTMMNPSTFNTFTFRFEGTTLWMTSKSTHEGPVRVPTVFKYVRVE